MNIALLLSGGIGTRMGTDMPKQYLDVCGRPIISFSLETLLHHDRIDALYIAAEPVWRERIREWLHLYDKNGKFRGFSETGKTRQISILCGLEKIKADAADTDCVLIHDAARPMLSSAQITDALQAMSIRCPDGVMPALPMKDTVYASKDGKRVFALLERREIFAGQAPEVFRFGKYYEANRRLLPDALLCINGSTEPAVLAGLDIAIIPGDEKNFKITTEADLERFRKIIEERGVR